MSGPHSTHASWKTRHTETCCGMLFCFLSADTWKCRCLSKTKTVVMLSIGDNLAVICWDWLLQTGYRKLHMAYVVNFWHHCNRLHLITLSGLAIVCFQIRLHVHVQGDRTISPCVLTADHSWYLSPWCCCVCRLWVDRWRDLISVTLTYPMWRWQSLLTHVHCYGWLIWMLLRQIVPQSRP